MHKSSHSRAVQRDPLGLPPRRFAWRPIWARVSALLAAASISAQSADERWAGSIQLDPERTLDFHVRIGGDGSKANAFLDIPTQNLSKVRLKEVARDGVWRRFTLGPPNPKTAWAVFECRVAVDGASAVGVMLQSGKAFRVAMRSLAADAPVTTGWPGELPASPWNCWSGRVDLGNGQALRFRAHLAAQTSESPASGWLEIPVQGVAARLHNVSCDDNLRVFTFRPTAAKKTWAQFDLSIDAGDRAASGTMTQLGRAMQVLAVPGPDQPRLQQPVPPFPYREIEAKIATKDATVSLAGTLTVPEGEGPHPTALLLTGSGSQDRDETLFGHKPFLIIADRLARAGIAVLRVDDRGAGKSTGDPALATTADYADDARACLAWLSGRTEVDRRRIGLVGHSEGAWIAFMVAANRDHEDDHENTAPADIAWIVSLGGPGLSGRDTVLYQTSCGVSGDDGDPKAIEATRQSMAKVLDRLSTDVGAEDKALRSAVKKFMRTQGRLEVTSASVNATMRRIVSPWYRFFVQYDPATDLGRIRVPLLALNGELDCQVRPAENLERIKSLLAAGGNRDVTTIAAMQLNHLFQTAKTGAIAEYPLIEETFHEPTLARITQWIRERSGLDR